MEDRILRPKEACRYLGVSPATLWRLEQRGELPTKMRISKNAVGWFKSDLKNYLQDRDILPQKMEGLK